MFAAFLLALAAPTDAPARSAEAGDEPAAEGRAPQPAGTGTSSSARAKADRRNRGRRGALPSRRQLPPPYAVAPDDSRLPRTGHHHVLGRTAATPRQKGAEPGPLLGWSATLGKPKFNDRVRRPIAGKRPPPLGSTLQVGERFRYDVFFSGSPTGLAEAAVVEKVPGEHGAPPLLRLTGFARTSGVVSLLATITYELDNLVDAATGAPYFTHAKINRDGLTGKYKRRETKTTYFGRGHVEIRDQKDDRSSRLERPTPVDTYDSLSIMAWVRAQKLKKGEKAKAYALDGKTLLRVDITGMGPSTLEEMPTIGTALGIGKDDVYELYGKITRVNKHGAAIPGRRTYEMRVYISDDGRRIPLVLESDMWLGVIRLVLTQYDPPAHKRGAKSDSGPSD